MQNDDEEPGARSERRRWISSHSSVECNCNKPFANVLFDPLVVNAPKHRPGGVGMQGVHLH